MVNKSHYDLIGTQFFKNKPFLFNREEKFHFVRTYSFYEKQQSIFSQAAYQLKIIARIDKKIRQFFVDANILSLQSRYYPFQFIYVIIKLP